MKNRDLIIMLIDKSINAFGQVYGLTDEDKLKKALVITQSTIKDSFDFNLNDLSEKKLSDILVKDMLNMQQAQQLTDLLWTQAEILLKLNRVQDSLTQYKNTLQLLRWKSNQRVENTWLERESKISELEEIIGTWNLKDNLKIIQ